MPLLTVPGIDDSGPAHWQTLWEERPERECRRFAPSSWGAPEAWDWVDAVDRGLADVGPDCVVVAHSLGCLAAAHVASASDRLRGLVLVAPPDMRGPAFPQAAQRFDELDVGPLQVPALVVASTDDPYASPAATRRLALAWGAPLVDIGAHGHLNEASGLGAWDEGWNLVTAFRAGLGHRR